ncbi:MAG: hypothetical protein U0J38_00525 [Bacteroidales bacterium]|nr:hypothetical protein [Bacteroidales bacterium]
MRKAWNYCKSPIGMSYKEFIENKNIYFNFNTPNIETNELNEEEIEENVDIIKTSDMEYNIDKMQEKEIIELMLMSHDKINVEILDEKKAEKRLEEIEKESEKRQVYKKFEESGLSKEDILKLAAMMQEEENKKLEEIAKHNIETQSYLEEARRKSALNNLKSKFDEHNA